MMKSKILLPVLAVILVGSGWLDCKTVKADPINVLALDTSSFDTQILGALSGTTFTEVTPAAFASVVLNDYDILYVGSTFQNGSLTIASQAALNALNARAGDIAVFNNSGHGIVALSEPIGTGVYNWLPVSVASFSSGGNVVTIVDSTHPVMNGLTDAGLSYWYTSYHNLFSDSGSLTPLATGSGYPVTLAGTYGLGKIVLAGQDADFHYVYGNTAGKQQVQFLQNAIDWAAEPVPVPGAVLLGMIGLSAVGIKLRKHT